MDIAEKKAEILKLIERLQTGSERTKQGRPTLGEHLKSRRAALTEVQTRRERQGIDLLEDRLLRICQLLEERIARIEEIIKLGGVNSAQAVKRPADASAARAEDLDSMQPDLDGDLLGISGVAGVRQVESKSAPSLTGAIKEGVLPDILQLLASNNKTGTFSVEHGKKRIELYYREGQIFHAAGEGMSGQNAFFAAMALEEGQFAFSDNTDLPTEKTIDGNTQFMILEALRQIDEARGGGGGG